MRAGRSSGKANGRTLIYLGQGVTFRYAVPTRRRLAENIQLVVRDPGCLYDYEHQDGDDPMTRRACLHREDGWVLVTRHRADGDHALRRPVGARVRRHRQKRSREQRERESSLNLAEAALYAQGFELARNWPNGDQAARRRLLVAGRRGHAQNCPDRDTPPRAAPATNASAERRHRLRRERRRGRPSSATTAAARERPSAARSPTSRRSRHRPRGRSVHLPADPVPVGRQRRQAAVGAGPGRRARQAAQRRRPLKLEKLRESVAAGRRRRRRHAGHRNSGNQVKIDAVGSHVVVRCANLADPELHAVRRRQGPAHAHRRLDAGPAEPDDPVAARALQGARDGRRHVLRRRGTCPTNAAQLTGAVVCVDNASRNAKLPELGARTPTAKPAGAGNGLSANCINSTTKPGHADLALRHGSPAGNDVHGIMYFVNNSDGTCTRLHRQVGRARPRTVYETRRRRAGVLGALVDRRRRLRRDGSNGSRCSSTPTCSARSPPTARSASCRTPGASSTPS